MKKKLYATILSLCLLVAAFPVSVFADEYQDFSADGQVSTNLTYTDNTAISQNTFSVNIPTSLSWEDGNTEFDVTLGSGSSLDAGFSVVVSIDDSTWMSGNTLNTLRVVSPTSSDYYVEFSVQRRDNPNTVDTLNPNIAVFTNQGASPDGHVTLEKCDQNLDPSNHTYSGTMTFNISSGYNN